MIFMHVEGYGDSRRSYSVTFETADAACNAANEIMIAEGRIKITLICTETGKTRIAENGGGITGAYHDFGVSQANRKD